ncbi:MAG: TIGR02147 family protein [Myxococcota bacterium]
MTPSIYAYLDFRAYLRDWFSAKQAMDPHFSKRRFARLAGRSSPGLLADVMDGERQLTQPMVEVFTQALQLNRAEGEFFHALVQLDQAEDPRERNHAWERISHSRGFQETRSLDGASFRYLSCWWFPVVRELAHRPDFEPDPAWVARHVRPVITESQARRALEALLDLGMLVRSGDTLEPAAGVVQTPHEVQGLAVHNYHKAMLDRASEAVDAFKPHERHIVAATVSVPIDLIPRLKQEINALQDRLLAICDRFEGQAEQVLQIELLLFPLSDRAPRTP